MTQQRLPNFAGSTINAFTQGRQLAEQEKQNDFIRQLRQSQFDLKKQQQPIENELKSRTIGVQESRAQTSQQGQALKSIDMFSKLSANLRKMPPEMRAQVWPRIQQLYGPSMGGVLDNQPVPTDADLDVFDTSLQQEAAKWSKPFAGQNAQGQEVLLQSNDLGNVRQVDGFKPRARQAGLSLSTSPDGSVTLTQGNVPAEQLTKQNRNKVQSGILKAEKSLLDLDGIGKTFSDEFLTFGGKAKAGVGSFLDKTGLDVGQSLQDFNAKRVGFVNNVRQFFNTYRKDITGAAASVQELEFLMKSMLNENLGPDEFKSAYDQFIGKVRAQIDLNKTQLGINKKEAQAPNKTQSFTSSSGIQFTVE